MIQQQRLETCAPTRTFNFHVEDTSDRCYRDVVGFLLDRGGKRVAYTRKYSKLEKRRLPAKSLPLVLWTLNEKDIDFADLESFQVCNHFEGIGQLTTKRGFCELLREMQWMSYEAHDIAPRCYNLGDPLHREEFVEDFKLTAAIMLLKCALQAACLDLAKSSSSSSSSSSHPPTSGYDIGGINLSRPMLRTCLQVCCRYLRIRREGEWPGVERTLESLESDVGQVNVYLTDGPEWAGILQTSYAIAEQDLNLGAVPGAWQTVYRAMHNSRAGSGGDGCSLAQAKGRGDAFILRTWVVLRALQSVNLQFDMDGSKNIWVVKAPEACRGLGLKVLHRLEDILECERGMGGRTVQKYVETPLLAPLQAVTQPSSPSHSDARQSKRRGQAIPAPVVSSQAPPLLSKFDLRIWVVVTSFEPLVVAHVYPRVYGRRCGSPYSASIKSLGDSFVHLTNYSIQRKSAGPESGESIDAAALANNISTSSSSNSKSDKASVRRLRNVCDSFRGTGPPQAQAKETDLLVPHDEILRVVSCHRTYRETRWADEVWPAIKRKIYATLESSKSSITPRERSFEFLGFDVILDKDLTPWILEVNMSPAMAHRSTAQSALIADMVQGLMALAVLPSTGELEKVGDPIVPCCANLFDRGEDGFDRGFTGSGARTLNSEPPESAINWEPLEDPYAGTRKLKTLVPRQVRPAPLQCRFASEWSDAPPSLPPSSSSRPRPKSASGTSRPSSGAGFTFAFNASRAAGGTLDVSFAVVGHAIQPRGIEIHDTLCTNFSKLLLLQAWARLRLIRLRKFHEACRLASIKIEALARGFLAKCCLYRLRRFRAARCLQCLVRQWSAHALMVRRRWRRAAIRVQIRVRILLARRRIMRLRRLRAVRLIQRWGRRLRDVWCRRAAFRIVMAARSWLTRRRRCARIVFHLVALHYRRRVRAVRCMQVLFRCCLTRCKEAKRLRIALAEAAARKGREWSLAAIEHRRAWGQAVSVKLEILVYNEIHAMASEVAVECYAAALLEAAEEEAVQAAAREEMRLVRELQEASRLAAHPLSPGERERAYGEMLRQLDIAGTPLPLGLAYTSSPGTHTLDPASCRRSCDEGEGEGVDKEQVEDEDEDEVDTGDGECPPNTETLHPDQNSPPFSVPRSSTELLPGLHHVREYQDILRAQRDGQIRLLHLLDCGHGQIKDFQEGGSVAVPSALLLPRSKSSQGIRTFRPSTERVPQPPPAPPAPRVSVRPVSAAAKLGKREAREDRKNGKVESITRFPKHVRGTPLEKSTCVESVQVGMAQKKKIKKKKSSTSLETHYVETHCVAFLNPYVFAPAPLRPRHHEAPDWRQPINAINAASDHEREFRDAATRHETERSNLLQSMLNNLLPSAAERYNFSSTKAPRIRPQVH